MRLVTEKACELLEKGESFALAIIIDKTGAAPREAGAAMLVAADGTTVDTVGGGLVEADSIKAGIEALKTGRPVTLHFDLSNDDAGQAGLVCGGTTDVFVDVVDASLEANKKLYSAMREVLDGNRRAWFGIYPDPDIAGCRQCLLFADGRAVGAFEGDAGGLVSGEASFKGYDVFTESEKRRLYLQPVGTDAKAVIYGAGHVALQVAPLLSTVGFEVAVIDDREEFANTARYPKADRVIVVPTLSDGILDAEPCDGGTYCIIVTRGHKLDREVLQQLLGTDAKYIGMIGSRHKRDAIFRYLLEHGFTQSDIDRVHSPIGLSIGAETPEEIAVSIAAEMIAIRRKQ